MQKIISSIETKLPVTILREGKRYIAYTPTLDLSTSGKNVREAKKRFSEAVSIFFEECLKHGTLSDTLANLGWRHGRSQWEPPQVVIHTTEKVRVAFSTR